MEHPVEDAERPMNLAMIALFQERNVCIG
jgi:hypothetical protein